MPPARKFIKKIKDKKLKKKLEEAVLEIQKNPTCGTAKKEIYRGFMALMYIIIKPIMKFPILSK